MTLETPSPKTSPALNRGLGLWVGIPGPSLDRATRDHLLLCKPAAIVLFGRNGGSAPGLEALCRDLRSLLGDELRIAVDHEGGRIQRFPDALSSFPAARALGIIAEGEIERGVESAREQGRVMGAELRGLGIDVNLAPCVDLCGGADANPSLESRCFSSDPDVVIALARAWIHGHRESGVQSCIKHWPGLGPALVDPHVGVAQVNGADPERHQRPYKALADEPELLVMTTHVIWPELDDGVATFSAVHLQTLRALGYRGPILTDDLEMGAIGEPFADAVRMARAAGHTDFLVCADTARQRTAHEQIHGGECQP